MIPLREIVLGLVVIFAILAARRTRQPWYLVVAVGASIGIVLWTLRGDSQVRAINVIDVISVLSLIYLVAEALGLPRPLAVRLGIGLRSREWEYDARISTTLNRLAELIRAKEEPDHRPMAELIHEAQTLLAGLDRVKPPTAAWRELTDDIAAWYRELLSELDRGERADFGALDRRRPGLLDRHASLRRQYREEAGQILGKTD